MKKLRYVIPIFVLFIAIFLMPACAAAPEAVPEPDAAPEPEAVQEPEVAPEPEEPETIQEPEEVPAEEPDIAVGEPELVWSSPYENSINSLAVDPDGEILAAGEFKVTYMHLLADGTLVDVIAHEHAVEDLAFSLDGSFLAAGQGYHGVLLTDLDTGEEYMTLDHGHNSRAAFSPDGEHLATGDRQGILWLWRFADGEKILELEDPEIEEKAIQQRWVLDIDFHPSGKLVATTHNDDSVYIWDLEQEQVTASLQLDDRGFGFSPDETAMAGAVREDGQYLVRLWDVDGDGQQGDLVVPGEVQDIAFSPDGNLLAVATFGRPTVQDSASAATIYDLSTQQLLYTLDMNLDNNDYPQVLTFTPDGGHLAVGTNNGLIEFWRLPGAEPLEAPEIDMAEPPPLPSDVLFDTDSAELKPGADDYLVAVAADLYQALPEATITFVGHTDSRGDAAYNMELSMDRAASVKDWFEAWAQDQGIDSWVLQVDGRGDTDLKVPDTDIDGNFLEEAGALNRRVEIEIEGLD